MQRVATVASGIAGLLAVALGAFGAHGLRARFEGLPDGVKRLEWWGTAAQYHLAHALALGVVGALAARDANLGGLRVATWAFVAGLVLFSGSLYTMSLTGVRVLGAVTPFGGVAFMVGWAALAWWAWQLPRSA